MQLLPGSQIGVYVLESLLGSGAFGVVWLARRTDGGQAGPGRPAGFSDRVAIKVLHPQAAVSRESVERFRREAWALSRLQSPHIARMFEFLTGPPFGMALVMEYIQGELLSDVLKRARFSVEDAIGLGVGVLSGVAEMQSIGIIHRDIKPENVILRPNENGWHAVIFDFNLSRVKNPGGKMSSLTSMHAAIGTVPYMAPEQLLDARRVNEASDVYSTATILYRAVAGALPFDTRESLREKLQQEARPLQTGRDDPMAKGFERIITKALRRRPAERYVKAEEMLDDLARLVTDAADPRGSS
ncbi:MAG: serine/threonine protein kinase [Labilithrix sp.]|nr:serine/threonine protein kinase [Labilithrix sp.]